MQCFHLKLLATQVGNRTVSVTGCLFNCRMSYVWLSNYQHASCDRLCRHLCSSSTFGYSFFIFIFTFGYSFYHNFGSI